MADRIHLAANNPDLGGGEQMLLRHAEVLQALGHPVTVVAPDAPTEVLDAASALGVDVVAIRADGRRGYLRRLRAWDRAERQGLLWCHGLVPAFATTGHARRIVHLHQLPRTTAQRVALAVATRGVERLLTPSAFLTSQVSGSESFPNWTGPAPRRPRAAARHRIGFMGRLTTDKGTDLLARALGATGLADTELVIAGDDRWVPDRQRAPVTDSLAALGPRVRRLGHVTPEVFFGEVDLAVFPSRVAESFGLVVAEAMAAGVPFVISDAGALPEVAGPGHPWIATAGEADDLARVISRALAATPEEVRGVTDRARRRWEQEYSPQAGRLRVERLLEDLGVR